MANDGYIQIGVTGLRDLATGKFLPSVPIYIRTEDSTAAGDPICDISKVLSDRMQRHKQEFGDNGN